MTQQLTPAKAILATEERFLAIAPQSMQFEAEKGFALQVLKNNDYLAGVAQNDIVSFQMAVTNIAAIGLSLNPAEKLAYLIPRKGKVCLDVSYMGMCKLATDSGSIKWVQSAMVHENDSFTDNGPGNAPNHTYSPFAKPSERGPYVGAYCVAKTADGDFLTTIMTLEELESIKARSESAKKKKGPWFTDFTEQCKKTVVRRAFKMWPRSTGSERMAVAVDLSNQNEGFEPIVNSPNMGQASVDQNEFFVDLMEKGDNLGMFVFSKTIPVPVFTSLFNSFDKGEKTANKAIVNGMVSDGGATATEWIDTLENCTGDESQVIGFVEDHAHDVIEYIKDQLSAEAVAFFNEVAQ